MVPEHITTTADAAAIRADLIYMTRRWAELPIRCMFEIRAFKEGSQPQIAKYAPDWIDGPEGAVQWITSLNALGYNIYAVRNPINAKCSGSASDTDIVGAFFLWADCDDPAAAGNVLRFDGPKWSASVVTGTTPSTRAHTYWELAEPCTDMAQWRAMQATIAAHFASDPSVINPSRIMRVGGTVSYPSAQKQGRGYIAEITELRTEYADPRAPVTLEQMARVFGSREPARKPLSAMATPTAPRAGGLHIDTGAAMTPPLDRERLAIQASSGMEWHNAVIRLVASYVGKGLSDDEIHALTQPLTLSGYTGQQTAQEVQAAIDGARRKGWTPEPQTTAIRDLTPQEKEAIPPMLFRPWVSRDLAKIPFPEFLYSDFYARKYTSVTLAAPKVGKSMLGLVEAIDMATGLGLLTGVKRAPLKVVYYNAEDDEDVIDGRIAALLSLYGIPQEALEGQLFPTSGVEREDFYMVSGQEPVINEALFVSIEKFCSEAGADVLIFDPLQDLTRSPETNEVFRALGQRLRRMANTCGVALGLVHHTRKVAQGITPSIDDMRGGSALRGTARFNRILVSMTEDEAVKAGVENHRHFFRIGDMESNLAPPSSDVNRWYEKVNVATPNGQHVGAVRSWEWPDAFDGITNSDAIRVQSVVASTVPPPRYSSQSKQWVGIIVADVLGLDLEDKLHRARVNSMIGTWIKTKVLAIEEVADTRNGRTTKAVVRGENTPYQEVN